MRGPARALWIVLASFALVPAAAYAQATIAGTVRDGSGAVLPGVTVEASSPALIEQVRSVVTNGTGQYRIVDLRPGVYAVAFSGLHDVVQAKFGQVDNFVTLADKYGKQTEMWQGVDVTMNARPRSGLLLQGGISAGKTTRDSCDILRKLPETNPTNPYCHTETPFLNQIKLLSSYTIPRIDVQIGGTFQSFDAPQNGIIANVVATNAAIAPSLGRTLSGGAANVTVNLIDPFSVYGDRVNQLDLRVGKLLRVGTTRTRLALDFFNALNAAPVMTENQNYAAFRRPTSIMTARFAKVTMQFDF